MSLTTNCQLPVSTPMDGSTKWMGASVLVAVAVAVAWLNAPIVPALAGAIGAGLALYWRARRRGNEPT